ncbi:MBL fold metallo-hydrolase [Chloroflexota bacterium]
MNIHPKVSQINTLFGETKVALYLVRGEINAIIDTGTSESPLDDIAPALKDLGLTLADIDLILNTHGHLDHTGGNTAVKSAGNAQILIHANDATLIQNHELYFEECFGPMVTALLGSRQLEKEREHFLQVAGPNIAPDRQLKNNDVIELGDECDLRVIHLPGHSSGSVGFYWEKEGILFTGDSVQGLGKDAGALPILDDLAAYGESLKRLEQIPLKLMVQAHDLRGVALPPSLMKQNGDIGQFIRDCQEFTERLREVVRHIIPYTEGKPVMEIHDKVVEGLPENMGFKPSGKIPNPFFGATTVYFALIQASQEL